MYKFLPSSDWLPTPAPSAWRSPPPPPPCHRSNMVVPPHFIKLLVHVCVRLNVTSSILIISSQLHCAPTFISDSACLRANGRRVPQTSPLYLFCTVIKICSRLVTLYIQGRPWQDYCSAPRCLSITIARGRLRDCGLMLHSFCFDDSPLSSLLHTKTRGAPS